MIAITAGTVWMKRIFFEDVTAPTIPATAIRARLDTITQRAKRERMEKLLRKLNG